ncbi:hypothetical protein DL95DRAFT_445523 [Leptodontidium sp. 2 PMI_412]|nr:hypothetical protein DL95DRAFT_445523 [Leptodontidium sp. 2 PMI_412]
MPRPLACPIICSQPSAVIQEYVEALLGTQQFCCSQKLISGALPHDTDVRMNSSRGQKAAGEEAGHRLGNFKRQQRRPQNEPYGRRNGTQAEGRNADLATADATGWQKVLEVVGMTHEEIRRLTQIVAQQQEIINTLEKRLKETRQEEIKNNQAAIASVEISLRGSYADVARTPPTSQPSGDVNGADGRVIQFEARTQRRQAGGPATGHPTKADNPHSRQRLTHEPLKSLRLSTASFILFRQKETAQVVRHPCRKHDLIRLDQHATGAVALPSPPQDHEPRPPIRCCQMPPWVAATRAKSETTG